MLLYGEKAPKHFWRIAIVAGVLPSRYSEISEAIVKIAKSNTIFKHPINKFFTVENTYHDTNQTDKAKEQKLRREVAVLRENMNFNCVKIGERGGVFQHCKY